MVTKSSVSINFLQDFKWLGMAQIVLRMKGLIILPFITRELGTLNFGIWSQITIITSLIIPFLLWGTVQGFIRKYTDKPLDERLMVFRAWIYALISIFILVFVAVVVCEPLIVKFFLLEGEDSFSLIVLAALFSLPNVLVQAQIGWLIVAGEQRTHALALTAQSMLTLGAVVIFLLWGGSVLRLVSLMFFAELLFALILFSRFLLRYGLGPADFSGFRTIFRYGVPLMPMGFANLGLNMADRLVLARFVSISDIGIYNLAHSIAAMLVQTIAQPLRAYYPSRATALFNQGKNEDLQKLYELSAGTLFTFSLAVAVGLFVVGPVLMEVIAPPEFADGAVALPLIFLGYAVERQTTYNQQILQWEYRQHWITTTLFGSLILSLSLNLFLVPKLGILGSAIANLVSFTARYIFILILVASSSPIRPSIRFIFKVVAACGIMGVFTWALPQFFPVITLWPALPRLLILSSSGVVFFLIAAIMLRLVSFSDIRKITRWAKVSFSR